MTFIDTKAFRRGERIAVELPEDFAAKEGDELRVWASGNTASVSIAKVKMSNRELVARLRALGPPPGGVQKREKILPPKRRGL